MNATRKRTGGRDHCRHAIGMLEPLERRRLLAGNVTVASEAGMGELSIIGDNKSNQVQVVYDTASQTFTINGLAGTTINGAGSLSLAAFNVFGGISFDMRSGDDVVALESTPGMGWSIAPLRIQTGAGDDSVLLHGVAFADVVISTGNGSDQVTLDDLCPVQDLIIDTGNGADSIRFGGVFTGVVSSNVTINGRNGRDAIDGMAGLTAFLTCDIREVESVA